MFSISRMAFVVAFAFSAFIASPSGSNASTILPFDFAGNATTIATVTGTSGTLKFTLDLNDPGNVAGNFAMDIKSSSLGIVGQINLDVGFDPATTDYHDTANPPGVTGSLSNISMWQFTVLAGFKGFPLDLFVKSTLDTFGTPPLNPVLTLDIEGDLQVHLTAATPLPGALALFAGGLGMLGWFGSRRRRATKPIGA